MVHVYGRGISRSVGDRLRIRSGGSSGDSSSCWEPVTVDGSAATAWAFLLVLVPVGLVLVLRAGVNPGDGSDVGPGHLCGGFRDQLRGPFLSGARLHRRRQRCSATWAFITWRTLADDSWARSPPALFSSLQALRAVFGAPLLSCWRRPYCLCGCRKAARYLSPLPVSAKVNEETAKRLERPRSYMHRAVRTD